MLTAEKRPDELTTAQMKELAKTICFYVASADVDDFELGGENEGTDLKSFAHRIVAHLSELGIEESEASERVERIINSFLEKSE